jgi:C1A family cysteine protease
VTIIKDQKDCGTCWAFTATAFFESELIRRNQTNFMVDLAEQFLYQCDNASHGCQGGYVQTAMEVALVSCVRKKYVDDVERC